MLARRPSTKNSTPIPCVSGSIRANCWTKQGKSGITASYAWPFSARPDKIQTRRCFAAVQSTMHGAYVGVQVHVHLTGNFSALAGTYKEVMQWLWMYLILGRILMLFTQSWSFMPKPFTQHLNNGSPLLGSEAVVSEASPKKAEKVKGGMPASIPIPSKVVSHLNCNDVSSLMDVTPQNQPNRPKTSKNTQYDPVTLPGWTKPSRKLIFLPKREG